MAAQAEATRIDMLNNDILAKIFYQINYDDKLRLRRVCKRWKALLDQQLRQVRALRVGQFYSGGYSITSGLQMQCHEHQVPKVLIEGIASHRQRLGKSYLQETATLFDSTLISLPADPQTNCYSIDRFDYLHRALKQSHRQITMLSLGRVHLSHRLLTVIAINLPNLEHLELINCATKYERQQQTRCATNNRPILGEQIINNNNDNPAHLSHHHHDHHNTRQQLPSIESFAVDSLYSNQVIYNQHQDELQNMHERLMRAKLIKNCLLVQESRRANSWPNMRHLLVKDCNLLNEFNLSIIIAMTSETLDQLCVESSQYLTGEFLNYCGPNLKQLNVKNCPMLNKRFLDDLVKLKQLITSTPIKLRLNDAPFVAAAAVAY